MFLTLEADTSSAQPYGYGVTLWDGNFNFTKKETERAHKSGVCSLRELQFIQILFEKSDCNLYAKITYLPIVYDFISQDFK